MIDQLLSGLILPPASTFGSEIIIQETHTIRTVHDQKPSNISKQNWTILRKHPTCEQFSNISEFAREVVAHDWNPLSINCANDDPSCVSALVVYKDYLGSFITLRSFLNMWDMRTPDTPWYPMFDHAIETGQWSNGKRWWKLGPWESWQPDRFPHLLTPLLKTSASWAKGVVRAKSRKVVWNLDQSCQSHL